jgi:hypothetical protein
MLALLSAALLAAPFNTTYTPEGQGTYQINGWEPDTDGTFPVVIFMGSSG